MSRKYVPTLLPVQLDLKKTNTGEQLRLGLGMPGQLSQISTSSSRLSKQEELQADLNNSCMNIVKSHKEDFLKRNGEFFALCDDICKSDESLFESWVRDFHSEYDDSWYSMNRERLFRSFRPIWQNNPQHRSIPDLL